MRTSEWGELLGFAARSGLGGLILESIDSRGLDAPSPVVRQLRMSAQTVARRNDRLTAQLEPVLAALNGADIPVMLLKGAALSATVYASPDLRPMSDVDLLVRENDAKRAVAVLNKAGYRNGMSLLRSDFFPTYYYETELLSNDSDPLRIDLHARPLRPLRYAHIMSEDVFWQDARRVAIGQSHACVPSTEVMFVHLAAHAAFHGCSRLIWLYDLKRWADAHRSSIDWKHIVDLSATWRLSLAVSDAALTAEQQLGSIVPARVLDELRASRSSWRDRLALHQAPRDAGSSWLAVLANVLCMRGWRFRAGYVWALLRPDRGHLADVYPFRHAGWPVVAGVYRIIRVGGRLIGGCVRRLIPIPRLHDAQHTKNGGSISSMEAAELGTRDDSSVPARACPGL